MVKQAMARWSLLVCIRGRSLLLCRAGIAWAGSGVLALPRNRAA